MKHFNNDVDDESHVQECITSIALFTFFYPPPPFPLCFFLANHLDLMLISSVIVMMSLTKDLLVLGKGKKNLK